MSKRVFGGIRRLPSKRYQAYYTGPDGGRHVAHSTYARKSDAESWLNAEERLIDEGQWTSPDRRRPAVVERSPLTVEEYVRANIERRATRLKRPLKPSTVANYLQGQRLVVFPTLGRKRLSDLTAEDIHKWWAALPDAPTQNGNAYDVLRSVLTDAVDEGLIAANPCRIKGAGKPAPKRKGRVLAPDIVVAYLAAADDKYRPMLGILLWCSQRSGEVRALRRCDVSDDGTWVRVAQGVTRVANETPEGRSGSHFHIDTPKTDAGIREVAVPPIIVDEVCRAVAAHDAAGRGREDLLFPARNGEDPIADGVLRKAHHRALKRIGLEGITLHDLRRSGATLAGQSGATIKELMLRLGHTRPDVAMIYQIADRERDRQIAERMAQLAPVALPERPSRRWSVQVTDEDGVLHVDDVAATTLAEAVAQVLADIPAAQAVEASAIESVTAAV